MDDKWEIEDEISYLDLLGKLTNGTSVTVTYHGTIVGSFVPSEVPNRDAGMDVVDHLLNLDLVQPGPGFRFKDLIHEGHKY